VILCRFLFIKKRREKRKLIKIYTRIPRKKIFLKKINVVQYLRSPEFH